MSFKVSIPGKHAVKGKSVPWWTTELTILRKKTLALRRRYQRTKNDNDLRQRRKLQYSEGRKIYQDKLKEEKTKSWKQFCSQTCRSNPWNAVYKLASGKLQNKTALSTL